MKKSPLPNKKISSVTSPAGAVSSLTANESKILNFIESEILSSGLSPSYQEICDHFGFASFNSVQNYVKQLTKKGYVRTQPHQKRGLEVLRSATAFASRLHSQVQNRTTTESLQDGLLQGPVGIRPIPLLGSVAAGSPIERITTGETLTVPSALMKNPDQTFALSVSGDSMADEGIHDKDWIVVLKQDHAKNGDLVVASIQSEATVKRIYFHPKNTPDKRLELRPSNSQYQSQWFAESEVQIKGLVTGLLRKF